MANDFDDVYSFDRTYTTGGGGRNPYAASASPTTTKAFGQPMLAPDLPEPSYAQPAAGGGQSGTDVIAGAYQQFLGREGSQDEYGAHSGGGTWGANDPRITEQVGRIQNSPEGKTYSSVTNFQQQVEALESTADPTQRAQQRDKLARDIYTSLKQSGHDVKWNGEQLIVDGRPYDVAGGEWASQGSSGGSQQAPRATGGGWKPVDELNDLTFGSTMSRLKPYSFDGFGARGGTGAQLEGLVSSILANPESMPPGVVEALKAKAKDELAEMQGTREADLTDQAFQMGYEDDDSPFFMSERNAGRRAFDTSLVGANRDIDVAAATQNTADRRSAATLGTSYAGAGEGFRQAAADSGMRANSLAGDLALRRAGLLTNDRQFDAGYGLDLARFQQEVEDSGFARWLLLNGGV